MRRHALGIAAAMAGIMGSIATPGGAVDVYPRLTGYDPGPHRRKLPTYRRPRAGDKIARKAEQGRITKRW